MVCTLSKFYLSWLTVTVILFSCKLSTSNNMIFLAIWCKWAFFKYNKLHLPLWLMQFCGLWKIYFYFLTPIHIYTYSFFGAGLIKLHYCILNFVEYLFFFMIIFIFYLSYVSEQILLSLNILLPTHFYYFFHGRCPPLTWKMWMKTRVVIIRTENMALYLGLRFQFIGLCGFLCYHVPCTAFTKLLKVTKA